MMKHLGTGVIHNCIGKPVRQLGSIHLCGLAGFLGRLGMLSQLLDAISRDTIGKLGDAVGCRGQLEASAVKDLVWELFNDFLLFVLQAFGLLRYLAQVLEDSGELLMHKGCLAIDSGFASRHERISLVFRRLHVVEPTPGISSDNLLNFSPRSI